MIKTKTNAFHVTDEAAFHALMKVYPPSGYLEIVRDGEGRYSFKHNGRFLQCREDGGLTNESARFCRTLISLLPPGDEVEITESENEDEIWWVTTSLTCGSIERKLFRNYTEEAKRREYARRRSMAEEKEAG